MKICHDQCFTVDFTVQELVDNLKEPFASSVSSALNLDKLDARDFQVTMQSSGIQFYRIVFGGDCEK